MGTHIDRLVRYSGDGCDTNRTVLNSPFISLTAVLTDKRILLTRLIFLSAVTIGDSSTQSWERAIEPIPGPIGSLARQTPLFLFGGTVAPAVFDSGSALPNQPVTGESTRHITRG